ncbi:hypothetical protein VTP01DRAFT_5499, partial [Rhizomucor pusillus]|uniref:uncharacterized protein n=1 Tax=Rhizomucor pusillus TaxID=4840 RepID=UPI0037433CE7
MCHVILMNPWDSNSKPPSTAAELDKPLQKHHKRRSSQQCRSPYAYPSVQPPSPLSTTSTDTCSTASSTTSPTTPVSSQRSSPDTPLPTPTSSSFFAWRRPIRKARSERIRVLLVDDNDLNLQVLSKTLKVHMPETIQQLELAKSGLEALEILNQQTFDLILMDIDMPVLNGLETARHIRYSKEHAVLSHNRGIPIVAVTTNDTPEWKIQYARVGMNGCISKPVAPATLKQTISQVLTHGYSAESLAIPVKLQQEQSPTLPASP